MDDGGKVYQEAISDGLDDPPVMLHHRLTDDLIMPLQQPQHTDFIGPHLAAKADDVGEHDRGKSAGLSGDCAAAVLCHRGDYRGNGVRLSNRQGACCNPFPPLRCRGGSQETMRSRQDISPCPSCAAQAVLTVVLCQELARLQAEVKRLPAQLAQTSANSHKPPSSDPPTRVRVRVRELSTRQRGGQPGHRGATRSRRPVAAVDELHVCQPTHCVGCGRPLSGSDPAPLRHQVTELPPLKPTITEYQLHALRCGRCGVRTRAPLPEGVPQRVFGLRLQALVAAGFCSKTCERSWKPWISESPRGGELSYTCQVGSLQGSALAKP